ncbi:MAG: ABC transporter permease [Anaerolineae bacterium]|nr:ABC transporter permease [Anaerolineae bacterium]
MVRAQHETPAEPGHRLHVPRLRWLIPLLAFLGFLLLWEGVVRLELYPAFILPGPGAVAERFVQVVGDGTLWPHLTTTLTQMLLGLAIGAPLGVLMGVLLAKSRTLEALISPIILAAQSTPVVAYAPLLIIWFGSGITSKIIIAALTVFFPMLMNTMVGIRNVPQSRRDMMRLFNATPWQTFWKLEFPASLPVLFAALRVSVTLAIIGSIIGEFISASSGLGYLIKLARDRYDTPLVLVAVVVLAVLARLAYWVVTVIERKVIRWQRTG